MVTLSVRIEGAERALRSLRPELYLPALAQLLREAALLGEREARQHAPKDTGALARSITHEAHPLTARVYSPLQYAPVMEEGRRAGAAAPPAAALLGWMRRHGLGGVPPFVIARAIGRRGIKGRFFMRRAMQTVEQQLPTLAARAIATIEAQWGR